MLLACGPHPFLILGFLGWLTFVGMGVSSLVLSVVHHEFARPLGIGSLIITLPIAVLGLSVTLFMAPSFVGSAVLIGSTLPAMAGISMTRHGRRPLDPHRCRACNYELRGLVEPRCPECGTPFAARLMPSPPPKPADPLMPSTPKQSYLRRR